MPGKYLKKPTETEVQKKAEGKKQVLNHIWKWLVAAALLAVLLLNLFTGVFQIVRYSGSGMEPGLKGGQTLVILKTQKVAPGDVIAFYYNNQILVRRVITVGGLVEMDAQGAVSVDGKALDEPYVKNITPGQCNITFPYQVPADAAFVMGDNRLEAMDSRLKEIGTVPKDRIIGKVIFKL